MKNDLQRNIDLVRDWLLSKHPNLAEIDQDYDLIENGLIDSLSFVEFVFIIESTSGKSINMENIDVDDFRSISAINRKYFVG